MSEIKCSICGEENNEYPHTLKCNHTFHYKCLFLSFKNSLNTDCPYCRSTHNLLPVVRGVKHINYKIHSYNHGDGELLLDNSCEMILKRGKNKGNKCSNNCKLGYDYCGVHLDQYIKSQQKTNIKE
jgi:hypothetical protein